MDDFEIGMAERQSDMEEVFQIRRIVFIEDQNVPYDIEMDGLEDVSDHIIMRFKGITIGCGRIRRTGNGVKLERVAVLEEYRRRGFGSILMRFMVDRALEMKSETIYLHSQVAAVDFYSRFGFKSRGRIFQEADIDHVRMVYQPDPRDEP
ncbi:MAG: GNAT family N-acetyltransferase [Thermoplasmatota archaeon]